MGRQGIRRRKPRHELPEGPDLTEGDTNRLFGRFTWGAYTPAGTLERNGFFWRQLGRSRSATPGAWRALGYGMLFLFLVILATALVAVVLNIAG